jgi:hypothetical protein
VGEVESGNEKASGKALQRNPTPTGNSRTIRVFEWRWFMVILLLSHDKLSSWAGLKAEGKMGRAIERRP